MKRERLFRPRRISHKIPAETLGTTLAVAAGIEFEPWDLEQVVAFTEEYLRNTEGAQFERAFAKGGI
jgi:hypothetical protein